MKEDALNDRPHAPDIKCPAGISDCRFLERLVALENECRRLRDLSRTDELTGFFNYRHLMEVLDSEMERTRRTGLPVSLIMIDIDFFKHINDRFGHEKGNKVLKWSSRIFRDNIRCIDVPCRYGGEEFSIILPGTPLKGAVNVAERLRKKLSSSPATIDDVESTVAVTASFGVDTYTGRRNKQAVEFIEQTDNMLLEAKGNGRNQTCYNDQKVAILNAEVTKDERKLLGIKNRSKPSDG